MEARSKELNVKQEHLKFKFDQYLLLTEFEVRTVSYGPSFFPLIYGPSAKAINQREKTRIRNLQYGPRKLS